MLFIYLLVFLAATLATGLVRNYALSRKVLDIPNHRSSHTEPTPRGGGLAIVLAFYLACIFLFIYQKGEASWFYAVSSALLVAAVGFFDDHVDIPARWRIFMHFSIVFTSLVSLDGLPPLLVPEPFSTLLGKSVVDFGWANYLLYVVALVWLLNLFNFMDGIDGIAASEAIFVSLALAAFLWFVDATLFSLATSFAAASLGFLVWNWPKAKIFMGDAGSGFLGLMLGLLIVVAAQQNAVLLYCGLILLGIFIVDATYTLLIRFCSGQKWFDAHCLHTYQRTAKRYGHLTVLLVCWAINLFWLLPIAVLVFRHPNYALLGILVGYSPLVFLAYYFKAGQAELMRS